MIINKPQRAQRTQNGIVFSVSSVVLTVPGNNKKSPNIRFLTIFDHIILNVVDAGVRMYRGVLGVCESACEGCEMQWNGMLRITGV